MNRTKVIIGVAVAVTIGTVILWQATGGDYYTKFQVVEQVRTEVDPDDPLAAAGFYEGDTATRAVTHDEFRFGLLPTPAGILDKNIVSVASIAGPVWVCAIGLTWWTRRKAQRNGSTRT